MTHSAASFGRHVPLRPDRPTAQTRTAADTEEHRPIPKHRSTPRCRRRARVRCCPQPCTEIAQREGLTTVTVPAATASPLELSDRASLTTWAMVLGALLGAFMAVLNIQITNASLLTSRA